MVLTWKGINEAVSVRVSTEMKRDIENVFFMKIMFNHTYHTVS